MHMDRRTAHFAAVLEAARAQDVRKLLLADVPVVIAVQPPEEVVDFRRLPRVAAVNEQVKKGNKRMTT